MTPFEAFVLGAIVGLVVGLVLATMNREASDLDRWEDELRDWEDHGIYDWSREDPVTVRVRRGLK